MEGALPLVKLIEQFAKLPGVGRKTAQRFAFYVLNLPEEKAREFAGAILDACHAEGIPTGIETNLNAAWETIEPLLEKLDLVMCDLKIADEEAHKQWTGTGNALIKENIRRLAQTGLPYIVRTPLVPGATDSEENLRAIAGFLAEADVRHTLIRYELLNFNPLGAGKYESLHRKNAFAGAKPLSAQRVAALRAAAEEAGIPVWTE